LQVSYIHKMGVATFSLGRRSYRRTMCQHILEFHQRQLLALAISWSNGKGIKTTALGSSSSGAATASSHRSRTTVGFGILPPRTLGRVRQCGVDDYGHVLGNDVLTTGAGAFNRSVSLTTTTSNYRNCRS
jgi:hypothetical protein